MHLCERLRRFHAHGMFFFPQAEKLEPSNKQILDAIKMVGVQAQCLSRFQTGTAPSLPVNGGG